jgi:hypothetical protein
MAITLKYDQANEAEFLKRRKQALDEKREESSGNKDFIYKERIERFKPKGGSNLVRILQPTWENASEYAFDMWAHYNVSLNKSAFLCLHRMRKENCPVCEEVAAAIKRGDAEYAAQLKAQRRSLVYIIDRSDTRRGPLLWGMPYAKVYKQLILQSYSRSTGAYLWVDHPDKGHDISFTVKGTNLNTQYDGVKIEWDETPLSKDEDEKSRWLEYVASKPIPELLEYKDPEHIRAVLMGTEEVALEAPITASSKSHLATHKAEAKGNGDVDLNKMDRKELVAFIESKNLDVDPEMWQVDGELRDAIRVELGQFN